MPAPAPATIANDLARQIGEMVVSATTFRDANDFIIRRLYGEIDKLVKVDAAAAHILRAQVAQLTGDEDAMRYAIDCAGKLSSSPRIQRGEACSLLNLGFFSEAQKALMDAIDYRRGELSTGLYIGIPCGAFSTLSAAIEQADKMNLEVDPEIRSRVEQVMTVLGEANVSDEVIGAMLDVAGAVLRDSRTFFFGHGPDILVTNDADLGRCVYMTFRVAAPPEKVAEMQFDLACKLVDQFPELPTALSIGFNSVALQ